MAENGTANRVVAALDGSPIEGAVATWAAAHAERRRLPLELVHVTELGVMLSPYTVIAAEAPQYVDQIEAAARERLGAVATSLRERHPDLTVDVNVVVGSAAAALVELSEEATVVVGAPTKGTLARIVLGSTALAVVAHGHGTCVVVPEQLPPVGTRRVVVGADGSEPAARAVEFAAAEAAAGGGAVTVVASWWVEVDEGMVVTEPGSPRWDRVETRLRDALTTSVAEARAAHPDVPVEIVVRHGNAASAILAVAEELDAELVVVGRRGRGGFTGLLMGSVSRTVAQRASRPVAVVR